MLLDDARRDARFAGGELVLLADQDRSLWDAAQDRARARGTRPRARARTAAGPYAVQAAIASLHMRGAARLAGDRRPLRRARAADRLGGRRAEPRHRRRRDRRARSRPRPRRPARPRRLPVLPLHAGRPAPPPRPRRRGADGVRARARARPHRAGTPLPAAAPGRGELEPRSARNASGNRVSRSIEAGRPTSAAWPRCP